MEALVRRRRLQRLVAIGAAMAAAAAAIASAGGEVQRPRGRGRYRCRQYRPPYSYRKRPFSLDRWEEAKVRTLCRFSKAEIRRILPLLRLDDVSWTTRNKPSQETAFCLLLCQLAYPGCLVAIADHFGRSPSWCSAVFNDVAIHLWTTF